MLLFCAFLLTATILCSLLLKILFMIITVEGTSMLPRLMPGDRVLVCRDWPTSWLRKDQLVIVTMQRTPAQIQKTRESLYIKRIVALEGEKVITSLSDLHETLHFRESAFYDTQGKRTWEIPPKHIFVCGDNTPCIDSRTWGPLPVKSVLGVVLLKLPRKTPPYPSLAADSDTYSLQN